MQRLPEAESAPMPRTALLAGPLRRPLLPGLSPSPASHGIPVSAPRPPGPLGAHPRLKTHEVEFAHLPMPLPRVDDVFIALGTTIKVAGSQEAFRKVDFDH